MASTNYDDYDFTTTEGLILEVLTAHARLGNKVWTFEAKSNQVVSKLASRGLVGHKSAPTEGATLVWLTELGNAVILAGKYPAPVKFSALKNTQKELRKKAKAFIKSQKGLTK